MALSKNFSLAGFDGKRREAEIARFAQDDGLHLRYYREGLCAIFDRNPGKGLVETIRLLRSECITEGETRQ